MQCTDRKTDRQGVAGELTRLTVQTIRDTDRQATLETGVTGECTRFTRASHTKCRQADRQTHIQLGVAVESAPPTTVSHKRDGEVIAWLASSGAKGGNVSN